MHMENNNSKKTATVNKIEKILNKLNLTDSAKFNYNLSNISSLRVGGKCVCFVKVDKRQDLLRLFEELNKDKSINYLIVGSCTNILFNDDYLDLLIIKLGKDFNYLKLEKNKNKNENNCKNKNYDCSVGLVAGAACNLQKFIIFSAKYGFDFSFLAGIPGTIGGAVIGNSGTSNLGINSAVKKIKYLAYNKIKTDKDFDRFILKYKTKSLTLKDFNYRKLKIENLIVLTDVYFKNLFDFYKHNKVSKNGIYLENHYKNLKNLKDLKDLKNIETLDEQLKKDILKKISEKIKEKKEKQPYKSFNAGCFFKNPDNIKLSAAQLIEKCGFKGFKFGGARVSPKHANFIENFKDATAKDIFILSKIIKYYIKDKYNIDLEYEIKLVGFK